MRNRLIDRVVRFGICHQRRLTIVGWVWFALSMGVYARFIPLPDLPEWTRFWFFWLGVLYNVLWWAALQPALAKRRSQLLVEDDGS